MVDNINTNNMNNNEDILSKFVVIITLIFIFLSLASSVNSNGESKWNNGYCSTCEARFELCGVSSWLKYYACPECGDEVYRY